MLSLQFNADTKSHKKRIVAILLVLSLLVVIASIGDAYNVFLGEHIKTQVIHKASPNSPLSLTAVINTISSDVTTKFPSLRKISGPDSTNSIGFPIAGYTFAVLIPYTPQTNLSFSDASSINEGNAYVAYQKALPNIENILSRAGLEALSANAPSDNDLETVLFFQNSKGVCQITSYTLLDIDCDSRSDLVQIAATARPLMTAYASTYPAAGTETIATPLIQASKTPGYTIASIAVFGNNGETNLNFYKQVASNWQVVNLDWYNDPHQDANIQPNCGDFDSLVQVREAFSGQACYDSYTRTESTVE